MVSRSDHFLHRPEGLSPCPQTLYKKLDVVASICSTSTNMAELGDENVLGDGGPVSLDSAVQQEKHETLCLNQGGR